MSPVPFARRFEPTRARGRFRAFALALAATALALTPRHARAADFEPWDPATPAPRAAARDARLLGTPNPLPGEALRIAAGLEPTAERSGPVGESGYGWEVIPPPARWVHTTIYDPLRDRLVVFGGQGYGGASAEVWALDLGGLPHWQQILPSGAGPGPRAFHCAIYDSLRDRMLVFGGTDANGVPTNTVWALSFAGNPAWSQVTTAGTPPTPRQWSIAVYDRARDRMLIMGGFVGGATQPDTWALSLAGTPTWTLLTPAAGPSPGGRAAHCGAYDAANDRLVIFGGENTDNVASNDAWALSLAGTPTWSLLAAQGTPPSVRFGTSAVYDRIRQRLVLFAGGNGTPNQDDLWTLSLGATPTWTLLAPTSPPPEGRQFHTASYDPIADRMVVFGGSNGPLLSDTWSIALATTSTWVPLSCTRRRGHTGLFDPARNRMDVFGGEDDVLYNDVWDLPLGAMPTWERLAPAGTPPAARTLFASAYDTRRDRMVVFGGRTALGQVADAWELTFSGELAWNPLAPTGTPPTAREDCASAYDSGHGRMIVFGGADPAGTYNDVWALALVGAPTWTKLTPTGTPPTPRGAASSFYDALRDRLIVFGGYDKLFNAQNDVYALSLGAAPAWTKLAPTGTPPAPRFAPAMIDDPVRDRLVLHGGTDFSAYFGDTWALSLSAPTPAWAPLTFTGSTPINRSDHKAIYDPAADRMLFFGGETAVGVLHDAWALTFTNTVDVGEAPGSGPPLRIALGAPRPNPARAGDGASFTLALPADAAGGSPCDVSVYDVNGRRVARVAHGALGAGDHLLHWDGRGENGAPLTAGVYFARAMWAGETTTRKVVLSR